MSEERRVQILAAVERWLSEHPDDPLPAGVDPEVASSAAAAPDQLALIGAIVACRHDVQIFGKACKRLEERVGALVQSVGESAAVAKQAAATAPKASDIGDLLDVFDRLRRCALACAEPPRSGGLFGRYRRLRAHVDGIAQGVTMTLDRLRELLAQLEVRPFDPSGEVFDAARMRALGTVAADDKVGEGRVADTINLGFIQGEAVVRPAEVRVARGSNHE